MKPIYTVYLIIALLFNFHKTIASPVQDGKDKSVKIGLLISTNKSVTARQGAELAIEKANQEAGNTGQSFLLVVKSMEGPWGTGSKQAVDMIFDEKVVALIGSHDGRNAHLVEQAAAKTRFVFISAWSSDPTLSQAFVPWYFSVVPNDIQQSLALINEIYNKRKIEKIAVISDNSYDSKQASNFFIKTAKAEGKQEPILFSYDNSTPDFNDLLSRISKSESGGILLFGEPIFSSLLIKKLKEKKMNKPLFGSINMLGERETSDQNIRDFEGVTLPSCGPWFNSEGVTFREEYKKKYGSFPDLAASYAFDAVNLIINAVKNGKTDYNLIQEWLLKKKYEGSTGLIKFDDKGNRIITNEMMTIKNGSPVNIGQK